MSRYLQCIYFTYFTLLTYSVSTVRKCLVILVETQIRSFVYKCEQRRLARLRECAGSPDYSLDARVRKVPIICILFVYCVIDFKRLDLLSV